jgi:DNA-binding transcriptional MerR regulator
MTVYNIHKARIICNCTARTLRFYQEKGYINPINEGQRRLYSVEDLAKVNLIRRLTGMGLPLDMAARTISTGDGGATTSITREQLIDLYAEMASTLSNIASAISTLAVEGEIIELITTGEDL